MNKINYNKHIWEGWRVQDFVDELEDTVNIFISNSREFHKTVTKTDLKKFIADNQPYIKKAIPEVVEHFSRKYNIK